MNRVLGDILLIAIVLLAFFRILITRFCKKKVYILNTPVHGNLGDQAILLSEIQFIKDVLPSYRVITIPHLLCKRNPGIVAKMINRSPVCIHGGGYLGDLWPKEDMAIRKMLWYLKANRVMVFPQTFYCHNLEKYLKESQDVFNNDNLYVFSRDYYTYNILSKEYCLNAFLSPDIVLYGKRRDYVKTNTISICLRNDSERTMSNKTKVKIMKSVSGKDSINIIDTTINKTVFRMNRKRLVGSLIDIIGKSQLLITDRLHGMIFAYLTKTPCLMFNSKSPKIKGVYKWIEKADYIEFHDDGKEIKDEVESMLKNEYSFNSSIDGDSFDEMKRILKKVIKG